MKRSRGNGRTVGPARYPAPIATICASALVADTDAEARRMPRDRVFVIAAAGAE